MSLPSRNPNGRLAGVQFPTLHDYIDEFGHAFHSKAPASQPLGGNNLTPATGERFQADIPGPCVLQHWQFEQSDRLLGGMLAVCAAGFAFPIYFPSVGVLVGHGQGFGLMALLPPHQAGLSAVIPHGETQNVGRFDPCNRLVIANAGYVPCFQKRLAGRRRMPAVPGCGLGNEGLGV